MQPRFANVTSAADTALLNRALESFAFAGASQGEEKPPSTEPRPVTSAPTPPQGVTDAPAYPWDCIAEAETGSDYSMTGSTYSTAFGMVNDIIYEYGTEEEQRAVFSGTASREQQIDIASRFAADNGFGGWGELTKEKCGL